ncbi:HvfC/BufC N-terminal domain-containing protein [Roseateles paludis]|jgi:hypothetical protein|uniref:DNA-binding domain-containing protein n=1 Tax=Roseateles paludis TaxID=3145238 RepID=A0ABV0FZ89_9BURK
MTMQLADQQRRLADAVRLQLDPQGVLAAPVEPGLAVYRNAYSARLLAALNDNYTVLARAMGDEDFEALGRAYLDAHPSHHPSIRWFGHQLAAFMAEADEGLVGHASFIDFARMDWALRDAFDALDAPLLSPQHLAALPTEAWADLRLCLHPSVRRVSLAWAIEPAWRVLRAWEPGDAQPELPEPTPHPHTLLVWREGLDTRWRSLEPLEAALLDAVAAGQTFAALCETAAPLVADPGAAVSTVIQLLRQWLDEGLLQAEVQG